MPILRSSRHEYEHAGTIKRGASLAVSLNRIQPALGAGRGAGIQEEQRTDAIQADLAPHIFTPHINRGDEAGINNPLRAAMFLAPIR